MRFTAFCILAVTALFIASCGARVIPVQQQYSDTAYDQTNYRAAASHYGSYSGTYQTNYDFPDNRVHTRAELRADRWLDEQILRSEFTARLEDRFEFVAVSHGGNNISATDYMLATSDVGIVTEPQRALAMRTIPGTASFAVFGLYASDRDLGTIRVEVDGEFYGRDEDYSGIYIGLSGSGGSYEWFGPFTAEDQWNVEIGKPVMTNPQGRSYVALAVLDGDSALIDNISVEMATDWNSFDRNLRDYERYYDANPYYYEDHDYYRHHYPRYNLGRTLPERNIEPGSLGSAEIYERTGQPETPDTEDDPVNKEVPGGIVTVLESATLAN